MSVHQDFYIKKIIDFLRVNKKEEKEVTRSQLESFINEEYGIKAPRKMVYLLKHLGYITEQVERKAIIELICDGKKPKLKSKKT